MRESVMKVDRTDHPFYKYPLPRGQASRLNKLIPKSNGIIENQMVQLRPRCVGRAYRVKSYINKNKYV